MKTNSSSFSPNTALYIKRSMLLWLLLAVSVSYAQKEYHKTYYGNGNIKEEGWLKGNTKTGYWKFYYKNGNLKKEGHYKNNVPANYWYFYHENSVKEKEGHYVNGKQNKWWLYYNEEGFVIHKCQLKDNKKNGYCLLYKEDELVKAVKFKDGKKINEWSDFSSFKKENNLKDLR